jgi:hypothetical protein
MGIMALVGKKSTKEVTFLGEKIKIAKLSVAQINEIQEAAKDIETNQDKGYDVLKLVIRQSAEGGSGLEDKHFDDFPMDELSKLSSQIMEFSGISQGDKPSGK